MTDTMVMSTMATLQPSLHGWSPSSHLSQQRHRRQKDDPRHQHIRWGSPLRMYASAMLIILLLTPGACTANTPPANKVLSAKAAANTDINNNNNNNNNNKAIKKVTTAIVRHNDDVRENRPHSRPFWMIQSISERTKGLSFADLNPFDDHHHQHDDDDDDETIAAKVIPFTTAFATFLYGTLFLVYPQDCRGQVYFMTMMRSTGYHKLENGVRAVRKNVRQAVYSAIWHAPSFLMAARSIRQMKKRVRQQRRIMAVTTKANEDGILTKREAKRIKKLRKNQIRTLQRDMKRMVRAGGSLGVVINVLDIDEMLDLAKGFLFQLTTVLATGHGDSAIGKFIARYCLTLNLGSLLLDIQHKANFPLTALILRADQDNDGQIDKKKVGIVNNVGKSLAFGLSGYLSFVRPKAGRYLNSALLGAAICLRGIKGIVHTIWDKHDIDQKTAKRIAQMLDGPLAGMLLVTMAGYGVLFGALNRDGQTAPPVWLAHPISAVESAIQKLTDVFHKSD